MRIALVSPLPPSATPWAGVAAKLIGQLQRDHEVEVFLESPSLVRPDLSELAPVSPTAELPDRLARGSLDLPIYFLGDNVHHLYQLRFLASCPGIVVLDTPRLDYLVSHLHIQIDSAPPRPFFDGFGELDPTDGTSLANAIVRISHAVIVTDPSALARLHALPAFSGGEHPTAVLKVVGSLRAGQLEPATAAEALLQTALSLPESTTSQGDRGPQPSVQAIVVSYNSKSIIAPCLQSLLQQDHPDLQVTVVDNDSTDGTAQFIRETFPRVQVIEARSNLGFGAGCNLGFQSSSSRYIALLNQDAIARRDWVTELVRVAEMDPKVAAVGSKLLMERCPTILNSTGIEINEAGWAWDRQVGERDDDPSPLPQEVFGVCGGALLLRRATIDAVGGFDPSFFMYFEDTDLCWRMRLSGYRVFYAPLAVVHHDFHGDSGATPGRMFRRRHMSERNRLQTLVKNAEWRSLLRVLPRILKYDRGRIKAYKANARRGCEPEFHRQLARILRNAWIWNAIRLPSLLVRRRRVQKMARARDDVRRFILPGLNEGGHQGDVDCFHDRFSAQPSPAIRMGESDQGSLGSGWHGVENPPGAVQAYRWCKSRSWFYLRPGGGRLVLKAASPIAPNTLSVFAEDQKIGEKRVDKDITELRVDLPNNLPQSRLWEFRLECDTIRLADHDPGGDIRDLGVVVFEMRLD